MFLMICTSFKIFALYITIRQTFHILLNQVTHILYFSGSGSLLHTRVQMILLGGERAMSAIVYCVALINEELLHFPFLRQVFGQP